MQRVAMEYIPCLNDLDNSDDFSRVLDGLERRPMPFAPWAADEQQPSVSFTIAYDTNHMYLKYFVSERTLRAQYSQFNDPVYEDSCVEFFIAFDNDESYYNLEFNCFGTSRVQYGLHKLGRAFIPVNMLKTIEHQTLIKSTEGDDIEWELALCIPKNIFTFHPALCFEGSTARVNFFKCGDSLPEPHYLCWNNIHNETPEFHLPQFFKPITFSTQQMAASIQL
ncbi:hypothetical protein FFF34_007825 [Inquilinus sp. KBS0705]|nr:hypothetical protein FFF34_007825 [Inquilinus sp. KBS0705]